LVSQVIKFFFGEKGYHFDTLAFPKKNHSLKVFKDLIPNQKITYFTN